MIQFNIRIKEITVFIFDKISLKKKSNSQRQRVEQWLPGFGRWENRDIGQSVQTISYKMNTFWGSNVQHGDCSKQYLIVYWTFAKRFDLKYSLHTYTQQKVTA